MKFTKHNHTRLVGLGYDYSLEAKGFLFSFPEYPQLQFFVFKHPTGVWLVREASSGLKAGTAYSGHATRIKAVQDQFKVMETMRNSPRGNGRHEYVVRKFKTGMAKATCPA